MTTASPKVTPITTPKRQRRSAPHLHVVPTPDLPAMERMLVEAAQQMAPMLSRADMARHAAEVDVEALQGQRKDVATRQDFIDGLHATLSRGLTAELADIDSAIAIKLYGIAVREPQPASD